MPTEKEKSVLRFGHVAKRDISRVRQKL